MTKSKLILRENFLTDKANLAELQARETMSEKEEYQDCIENWTSVTDDGRLQYLPFIINNGIDIKGKVIDIGAGICWLSAEVSKLDQVKEVYALEFSKYLLKDIAPEFMSKLNANEEKLIRIQGDFNAPPFEDEFFDTVVIGAALHHATDLNHLLKEIYRILKPGGIMIAIREPVLPSWRPWLKNTFGKKDKENGITENIYSLEEWNDAFKKSELNPRFIPFIPKTNFKHWIISLLMPLNKQLIGHYIFIAKKR